jgi:hypothetical protein
VGTSHSIPVLAPSLFRPRPTLLSSSSTKSRSSSARLLPTTFPNCLSASSSRASSSSLCLFSPCLELPPKNPPLDVTTQRVYLSLRSAYRGRLLLLDITVVEVIVRGRASGARFAPTSTLTNSRCFRERINRERALWPY